MKDGQDENGAEDGAGEVMQRRFDWALREITGGVLPPDVTRRVLERHAEAQRGRVRRGRGLWRAAAVVLLGLGAVIGVFLLADYETREPAGEQTQDPEPVELAVVAERAAVAVLPPDTRAVELRDLGDDAVAALVRRCPRLEHLRVFASTGAPSAVSITDAALPEIARLYRLRVLELVGTDGVIGSGLRALEALPLLETLVLTCFDLDDAALQMLPRLPSLRALDLSLNHGFGDAAIEAIARCPGLRRLGLDGCPQLDPDWIARLGALRELVELNLGGVGRLWRGVGGGLLDDMELEILARALRSRYKLTASALPGWPRLQVLRLRGNDGLGPDIGEVLRERCPNLTELDLSSCAQVDDTTVADVLALPQLRRLDLSGCARITQHCLPRLGAAEALREVRLGELAWLKPEHADALRDAGKVLHLDTQRATQLLPGLRPRSK